MPDIGGEDEALPSLMDRVFILSCLHAAEKHIASFEQLIVDQCGLIRSLERANQATNSAIALFRDMEQKQLKHLDERDQILAELRVVDAVGAARRNASATRGR